MRSCESHPLTCPPQSRSYVDANSVPTRSTVGRASRTAGRTRTVARATSRTWTRSSSVPLTTAPRRCPRRQPGSASSCDRSRYPAWTLDPCGNTLVQLRLPCRSMMVGPFSCWGRLHFSSSDSPHFKFEDLIFVSALHLSSLFLHWPIAMHCWALEGDYCFCEDGSWLIRCCTRNRFFFFLRDPTWRLPPLNPGGSIMGSWDTMYVCTITNNPTLIPRLASVSCLREPR